MNWNIFKRLRTIDETQLAHTLAISALLNRISTLERQNLPAKEIVEVAADKLLKIQAYRRAYYRKNKAEKAALKDAK
jgi:hypothetical protein